MVDIIDEAKEEARLEALQNFVKKHLTIIVVAVVACLALFASISYYADWSQKQAEKAAESFVQTLESIGHLKPEEQQKRLAFLFETKGYGDLAKLISAQILLSDKSKIKDALALLQGGKIDSNLKQFLTISLGYNLLNFDKGLDELAPALEDMVRTSSFLKGFAQEILGLWLIQKKDYVKAHELFEALSKDGVVSEQTRSRADIYKRQLECEEKC